MPKAKPQAKAKPEASEPKGFVVFDSNGKKFRVVKDREEAESLAKVIDGRVK